jgi:hypothetical protein
MSPPSTACSALPGSLAKEGGPNTACTANVVCPGFVTHAAGREADPGTGQGAWHLRRSRSIKKIMLKRHRRYGEFTTDRGRCRSGAAVCRFRDQCADRPVARRQPRLVHAISDRRDPAACFTAGSRLRQRAASSLSKTASAPILFPRSATMRPCRDRNAITASACPWDVMTPAKGGKHGKAADHPGDDQRL